MKKILLVGVAALLISGCTTNSDNFDKDLFTKKKECAELQPQIESRIKDWNDEETNAWLNKIFYSPTKNTCMYTMELSYTAYDIRNHIYRLFDAFTNEVIEDEKGCIPEEDCGKSLSQASIDFDEKVYKYR